MMNSKSEKKTTNRKEQKKKFLVLILIRHLCASLNLLINNDNNFDLLSGKIVYYTIHTSKK